MATTTFSPDPDRFAFTTFPQIAQEISPLPRAEVVFRVVTGVIAAGGGGDQAVLINMAPPLNFSYVLVDCFMTVNAANSADIADWDAMAVGTIQTNEGVGEIEVARFQGWNLSTAEGASIGDFRRVYQFDTLPKRLFNPTTLQPAICMVSVSNPVIGGLAADCDFFGRFLQYDVSQKHHVAVNSPELVR